MLDLYNKLGASSSKEDVHAAIQNIDKGIAPGAFCKVLPDILGGNPEMVNCMHADGAGTKSILAYLYWRETGDISVWKNIAIDALVMNLDDVICAGATSNFIVTSTIGRNKALIPKEVIKAIIEGTEEYCQHLRSVGIDIHFGGGETADVGDLVRTIIVDSTLTCRFPKKQLIDNHNIRPGQKILGIGSAGKTNYESELNSGIASNGITLARHTLLSNSYASQFPEALDPALFQKGGYNGRYSLLDQPIKEFENLGKALLSPTRTYAPLLFTIRRELPNINLSGIIHNSGGGLTKVLRFIQKTEAAKQFCWPIPPIFNLIKEEAKLSEQELFQTFNCGIRLELYLEDELIISEIEEIARNLGLETYRIGKVLEAKKSTVSIASGDQILRYSLPLE